MNKKSLVFHLFLFIFFTVLIHPMNSEYNPPETFNSKLSDNKYIILEDRTSYNINRYHRMELKKTLVIKILPSQKSYSFSIPFSSDKNTRINEFKILKRKNIKYISYDLKSSSINRYMSYNIKKEKIDIKIKSIRTPLIMYLTYSKKFKNKIYTLKETFKSVSNTFKKEIKIKVHKDISLKFLSAQVLKHKKSNNYNYKTYYWKLNYMKNPLEKEIDLKVILYKSYENLRHILKNSVSPKAKKDPLYDRLAKKEDTREIINYFKNINYQNNNIFKLINYSNKNLNPVKNPLYSSLLLSLILKKKGIESSPVIFFKTSRSIDLFKNKPFLSNSLSYGITIKENSTIDTVALSNSDTSFKYSLSLNSNNEAIPKLITEKNSSNTVKINCDLNIINMHIIKISIQGKRKEIDLKELFSKKYIETPERIRFNTNENPPALIVNHFIKRQSNFLIIDIDSLFKEINSKLLEHIIKKKNLTKILQLITINKPENFKFLIYPNVKSNKENKRISRKTNNRIYYEKYLSQNDEELLSPFKGKILLLKKEKSFIFNIF